MPLPLNPNTLNDTEGVATDDVPAPVQPAWEKNLKRGVAAVVATCGALITVLPEHTVGYKVCFAVVGIGAALGITSTGNAK